jgi:1,6-anhydro-N-acetylmuramate kinase
MLAIGLMSGTSQDGVDVVLPDTDGERIGQLGGTACRPYSEAERTLLRRATAAAAANLIDRTARPRRRWRASCRICRAHRRAGSLPAVGRAIRP